MKNLCMFICGQFLLIQVIVSQNIDIQDERHILNSLFISNNGWNGGDGAYSLLLADKRILWSFGDSFYGRIDSGRVRNGTENVMVRNAFLVQKNALAENLISINPVTKGKTLSFFTYGNKPEQDHWYWPLSGFISKNEVVIALSHMVKTGSGEMWDFTQKSVDLAILTLPDLKPRRIVRNVFRGETGFGSAIYQGKDGFLYIYGSKRVELETFLYVARVPANNPTGKWQYWNDRQWEGKFSGFAIHKNISSMFSIWSDGKIIYLLTQDPIFGRKIRLCKSDSPVGPFTDEKVIYEVPEEDGTGPMFSYNAIAHPEFSDDENLIISYSKNPHRFWDNFNNFGSADLYNPVFIKIRNWKFISD